MQFVGQLKRQALARFYALHHVGVFPSIHPEAFGIVAAEMMASGLAVVSSGVGGAGELIEDGYTGLRFKPGDSEDLARLPEGPCKRYKPSMSPTSGSPDTRQETI